jgi:molybdate transport system substrate-binding protein
MDGEAGCVFRRPYEGEGADDEGMLVGPAMPYVTNTLAIMVPKDNPANIKGPADLGRRGLRLAMPNPAYEGIARQIKVALTKAGGAALADAVYDTKVHDTPRRYFATAGSI